MLRSFELAGFFAGHAIWCVSEGDTLIPMLAYTSAGSGRKMERLLVDDDPAASVAFGREKMTTNPFAAENAALIYDGLITIDVGNVDAIILEIRTHASPQSLAVIAIPYAPARKGAFRVHKPKVLEWHNCESFDLNLAMNSFFDGVDQHEQGSKLWAQSFDETI